MGLPRDDEGETSPMGGGGVSPNSEESPSQQPRGRGAGGRERTFVMPGESPVMALRPLPGHSRARPRTPCPALPCLRTACPGPRRSPVRSLRAAGSCWPQQNFERILSMGALGGPRWARKLLTIPILNTSVMVYGPERDNYGVQNLAFMAPPPRGALREQYVSCSQFR